MWALGMPLRLCDSEILVTTWFKMSLNSYDSFTDSTTRQDYTEYEGMKNGYRNYVILRGNFLDLALLSFIGREACGPPTATKHPPICPVGTADKGLRRMWWENERA